MSSFTNQVRHALAQEFGPVQNFVASALGAATQSQILVGRGLVYGIQFLATASIACTLALDDASATGTGVTPHAWFTNFIPSGGLSPVLPRPILFSNGISLNYTASGAATVSANIQWVPAPDRNALSQL